MFCYPVSSMPVKKEEFILFHKILLYICHPSQWHATNQNIAFKVSLMIVFITIEQPKLIRNIRV